MFHRLIGALIALLVSGFAWSAPCAPDLPDRLIPEASGNAFTPKEIIRKVKYDPPSLMAKRGFNYVLGMWNASTVYPCERARPATIEFRRFEVVRLDPSSGKLVVEHALKFDGSGGSSFAGLQHHNRSPLWFESGFAKHQPQVVDTKEKGILRIDLKSVPENLLHGYTERKPAVAGHVYGVRMEVRITGDARLQSAMDYWRGASSDWSGYSDDCVQPTHEYKVPANNCEAWLGDWIGDTGGKFITVVEPRSLLGNSQ